MGKPQYLKEEEVPEEYRNRIAFHDQFMWHVGSRPKLHVTVECDVCGERKKTAFNDVRFALLGGSIVDANALLRAYIWHCIAIPLIASVFMGLHFWRVRKDGGISGPAPVMLESEIKEQKGPRPVIMKPSGMQ